MNPETNEPQSTSQTAPAAEAGTHQLAPNGAQLTTARAELQLPMRPASPAAPQEQGHPKLSLPLVLNALRRRWFLALVLGVTLSAGAATAAWLLIPAPYTAVAYVTIKSTFPEAPGRAQSGKENHDQRMKRHMQMVKDRDVLEAALRDVARLSLLKDREEPRQWLQENVKVEPRGIEVFSVSLTAVNAEEAKQIVNAIIKSYEVRVVDHDRKMQNNVLEIYQEGLKTTQGELEKKRRYLKDLVEKAAGTEEGLKADQEGLVEQRTMFAQDLAKVRSEMLKLKSLRDVQSSRKSPPANAVAGTPKRPVVAKLPKGARRALPAMRTYPGIPRSIVDSHLDADPEVQKLKGYLESLKGTLHWQEANLTPNHKDLTETKRKIEKTEGDIHVRRQQIEPKVVERIRLSMKLNSPQASAMPEDVDSRLKVLAQEEARLVEQLKGIRIDQQKVGSFSVEIAMSKKDIERLEKQEGAWHAQVVKLKADKDLLERLKKEQNETPIRTRAADLPARADMKKRIAGASFSGIGALGLVLFGIVFLDIRSRRINSVQQVAERVGMPVLGSVPAMPRNAQRRSGNGWSAKARYWHGVLTESIDAARTLLLREAERHSMKVIMLASSSGGEGKTTVACHLATSLARAGQHVLLVDGDMRRPFVHRTFETELGPGLAELLRGEAEFDECLQPSGIARMPILPAGEVSAEALELLAQGRFGELIAGWRERFDFIIIDSSPVLPVTDSLLLAQHVDGVLFAIRRDVSRVSRVLAACRRLTMLGVPLLGAVAIGLDDEGFGPGYSYRYGYGSGYGYGYEPHG